MKKHTTPSQRRTFCELHEQGLGYREIAEQHNVSKECVRYWCRRNRDGGSCQSSYHREPSGILSRFDGLVRYWVLRLRLKHPRWGPKSIRYHLSKVPSLKGLVLPSRTQIGRYLHQWERFRRKPKKQARTRVQIRQRKCISNGKSTSRPTSPCRMERRSTCTQYATL